LRWAALSWAALSWAALSWAALATAALAARCLLLFISLFSPRACTDHEKQCGTSHACVVSGFKPAAAQLASKTTALAVVSRHCTVCVCEPLAPHAGPQAPKPSDSHA